jgi:hypothetical protein
MSYKFNPFTGQFDYYETGTGTGTNYFVENGNSLELWYQGQLVNVWTLPPAGPVASGSPFGAWLGLWRTYP